jgi:hypothetical protein
VEVEVFRVALLRFGALLPGGGVALVVGGLGLERFTQGPGIQQAMRFAQTTKTLIAVDRDENAATVVDQLLTGGVDAA